MIVNPQRLAIAGLTLLLTACVNQTIKSSSVPSIDTSSKVVAEGQLLDVGIVIFDPGLEEYEEDQQVYPEVRKAEARYMPRLLAEALQESGAWGAVRVVPSADQLNDLQVAGDILHSDGESLKLHITATDSRGVVWLEKTYNAQASRYAYKSSTRNQYDPFQAVYHHIANDLLEQQEQLSASARKEVRLVTQLLFARSFSDAAFGDYLDKNRKGKYVVTRLPALDDPMLERVRSIRERDQLFIDTMQEYYGSFGGQMEGPYQEWRKLTYEEALALQQLKGESTRRLIAGGLAVLAGIAAATSSEGASRAAGNVAIIGGGYLLKSGLEKRNEAQIHVQALEELGMSLEAEITPQVIELDDRTVMLSGSVEDQYAQWREILADIYQAEIGSLELPPERAADPAATDQP